MKNLPLNRSFVLTYIAILLVTILALWAINALKIAYPLSVTTSTTASELAVVGEGKVEITPDTASVDMGIVTSNSPTVEAAQTEINRVNNAIVAAMQELGIEKGDIKTSNYSVYPNYSYQGDVQNIIGYNGNVTITIKVRNPEQLPQVLEAGTRAGANQILGTQYLVENPNEHRQEARDLAIQNAKEQAEQLAQTLGIRLGKVVNVVEASPSNPDSPLFAREGFGGGAGAPNLQPGTQTITSVVTLYFEKQ